MESDSCDELVYYLDNSFCLTLRRSRHCWQEESGGQLKEYKGIINPNIWHKGEKSSRLIDSIVCLPAGGSGVVDTHRGFPVFNMLVLSTTLNRESMLV